MANFPIIKQNLQIINFFTIFFGEQMNAVTLYPYIFTRYSETASNIINHEKIHCEQYKETLIIGYYFIFFINYIINWFYYLDVHKAYRNVLFEKEAYENMNNYDYLKYRRRFSWIFRC